MLNDEWLRKQVIPQLQNGGLIELQKPELGDKRSIHIFPKWFPGGEDGAETDYIGNDGGVFDQLSDEDRELFFGKNKPDESDVDPDIPDSVVQ
jgi:hypothetical protein